MNIDRIFAFNQFYTTKLGLITNHLFKNDFSMIQAKLLSKINEKKAIYASDLVKKFSLSADYVSKIITKFETRGLIARTRSFKDRRKKIIALTPAGKRACSNQKKREESYIKKIVKEMTPEEDKRLVGAMNIIEEILSSIETQ